MVAEIGKLFTFEWVFPEEFPEDSGNFWSDVHKYSVS